MLADLSGAIGNKVGRELPDADLVRRTWNSVRDLRDVHGVSEEAMENIVPESWRDRAFRAGEQGAPGQSLQAYCLHTTPKLSAPAKRSIDLVNWSTEYVIRGTSLRWTRSPRRGPSETQRTSRQEGDARLGQGPATESIGIRGYRLPKGEACRLS